jgi:uncharacterized protein (UPF0254 family)
VHQRLQAVAALDVDVGSTGGVKRGAAALEEDVFGPVLMISKEGKVPAAAGSAEERQRALFERVCRVGLSVDWADIPIDQGPVE